MLLPKHKNAHNGGEGAASNADNTLKMDLSSPLLPKKIKRKVQDEHCSKPGRMTQSSKNKRAKKYSTDKSITIQDEKNRDKCNSNNKYTDNDTEKAAYSLLKTETGVPEEKNTDNKEMAPVVKQDQDQAEALMLLALGQGGSNTVCTPSQVTSDATASLAFQKKNRHRTLLLLEKILGSNGGLEPSSSPQLLAGDQHKDKDQGTAPTATATAANFTASAAGSGCKGGDENEPLFIKSLKYSKDKAVSASTSQHSSLTSKFELTYQKHKNQLLLQQQALDKWRAAATSSISRATANDGLLSNSRLPTNITVSSSCKKSSKLEQDQEFLWTAQKPHMVSGNSISQVKQGMHSREVASLSSSPPPIRCSPGTLKHSPVSSQTTLPAATANNVQQRNEVGEKTQLEVSHSSSCAVPPFKFEITTKHDQYQERSSTKSTTASTYMASLLDLTGAGQGGPTQPGLAERLQAALKEQQSQQEKTNIHTTSFHEHESGPGRDSQVMLQRQLADYNDLKKAAFIQNLPPLQKSGGGGGQGTSDLCATKTKKKQVAEDRCTVSKETEALQTPLLRHVSIAAATKHDQQNPSNKTTGTASDYALLSNINMGHEGPIPPGLAEHLKAVLKEQQYSGQQPEVRLQAATDRDHKVGGEEDRQTMLQRQLANDVLRAPLAKEISSMMNNCGVGYQGTHQVYAVETKKKGQVVHEQHKNLKEKEILPFQQTPLSSLNTLKALQRGISSSSEQGVPKGIDKQALLQYILLKEQIEDMNKQSLEQNVQGYMQEETRFLHQQHPHQQLSQCMPPPSLSGLNQDRLSRDIDIQSLLAQVGGSCGNAQQNLWLERQSLGQPTDLLHQTACQTHLLDVNQGRTTSANNCNQIYEALRHGVARRRLAVEAMLISEENRLRQLREALRSHQRPQQQDLVTQTQMLEERARGGGSYGRFNFNDGGHSQLNSLNPNTELILERERTATRMSNDELQKAILVAEINSSRAEQQMQMQEIVLQQAMALEVSQPLGAGTSPEILLEVAQKHGLDLRAITPDQLSLLVQLIGMDGRGR